MATLVAIGYPDQGTAEQARQTVQQLEAELIIQADQVASISRDLDGKYHVHTTHGGASAGGGAIWGSFWGLLFGLLFFVPFAGLALGAGFGALFGHLGEKGIDKAFQEQVRDYVKPGTSALFMVIEQATPDKAVAALEQYGGTVIKTSLSDEDTKKLQEALTPPEDRPRPRRPKHRRPAAAGACSRRRGSSHPVRKERPMAVVGADTHQTLAGISVGDADILETAIGLRELNREGSGLDGRTFALVKIASLIALDAPPASYAWQIANALEDGVTPEDILGVLRAVAPQVGGPRVIAAGPEIMLALGLLCPDGE